MPWLTLISILIFAQPEEMERAEALIGEGRFRDARELAKKALTKALPEGEKLLWKWITAEAWREQGDYEEAELLYAKLSREGPGWTAIEATLELARCQIQMWDAAAAEETLESLDSRELGGYLEQKSELVAISRLLAGHRSEAKELFESLPNKSGTAWHYLGVIAFDSAEFENALGYFDRAIVLSPDDIYNHLYRATCLVELNRLKEASSTLKKLLEKAKMAEAYWLLGQVELRSGNFSRAESHFGRAMRVSPNHAKAQFGLATALKRQGKEKGAREAFKKFRALHLKEQESLKRTYELDQALAADAQNPQPAEELALHYYSSGDPQSAERMAWRALRIDPSRTKARLCLARSLTAAGSYGEAATQYQRILRTDPAHLTAKEEYRELLRRFARKVDD